MTNGFALGIVVAIVAVAATASCSDDESGGSGGGGGQDASSGGSSGAAGSAAGAGGSGNTAGTAGAAGSGSTLPPGCFLGTKTPDCNPVTNAPCDTAGGHACDSDGTSFVCYPPPNDVPPGGACDQDNGPFCVPSYTCVSQVCRKYCCASSDCQTNESCEAFDPVIGTIGVCVPAAADGGTDAASDATADATTDAAADATGDVNAE